MIRPLGLLELTSSSKWLPIIKRNVPPLSFVSIVQLCKLCRPLQWPWGHTFDSQELTPGGKGLENLIEWLLRNIHTEICCYLKWTMKDARAICSISQSTRLISSHTRSYNNITTAVSKIAPWWRFMSILTIEHNIIIDIWYRYHIGMKRIIAGKINKKYAQWTSVSITRKVKYYNNSYYEAIDLITTSYK